MRSIHDIERRGMNDNGKPERQPEEPAPMGKNGLIALGMVCGTIAWIVYVIWG